MFSQKNADWARPFGLGPAGGELQGQWEGPGRIAGGMERHRNSKMTYVARGS
jgi:hypothetical protein